MKVDLKGKIALVTGAAQGIGLAIADTLGRNEATVVYTDRNVEGAEAAAKRANAPLGFGIDVSSPEQIEAGVARVVKEFGRLDILVNNAAEQHEVRDLSELTAQQIERTFRTNVFSFFFMAKAAVPHMKEGSCIINTTSVTAYQGHKTLLDYSATKGAIVTMTCSLSEALIEKGIRVNAVAPGPIWTPLIPASFEPEHVARHGAATPMQRAGQPNEVAPCYVFLASDEASYISGQVLHPNGGTIVHS